MRVLAELSDITIETLAAITSWMVRAGVWLKDAYVTFDKAAHRFVARTMFMLRHLIVIVFIAYSVPNLTMAIYLFTGKTYFFWTSVTSATVITLLFIGMMKRKRDAEPAKIPNEDELAAMEKSMSVRAFIGIVRTLVYFIVVLMPFAWWFWPLPYVAMTEEWGSPECYRELSFYHVQRDNYSTAQWWLDAGFEQHPGNSMLNYQEFLINSENMKGDISELDYWLRHGDIEMLRYAIEHAPSESLLPELSSVLSNRGYASSISELRFKLEILEYQVEHTVRQDAQDDYSNSTADEFVLLKERDKTRSMLEATIRLEERSKSSD